MFKEGDYIVTLKGDFSSTNCGKENYCFKQRYDAYDINPVVDLNGSRTNGNTQMTFNKKSKLLDWRYATQKEISHYDQINAPYDVTEIVNKIYELW